MVKRGSGTCPTPTEAPIAIQQAMAVPTGRRLREVPGSRGGQPQPRPAPALRACDAFDAPGCPAPSGSLLRRLAYPWLLGASGAGVIFGQGVVLRHPHKIRLGDGVVVDDLVVLDAKGTSNRGIGVGNGVVPRARHDPLLQGRRHRRSATTPTSASTREIFSGSSVTVGAPRRSSRRRPTWWGAATRSRRASAAVIDQPRTSRGHRAGGKRLARHGGEGARRRHASARTSWSGPGRS